MLTSAKQDNKARRFHVVYLVAGLPFLFFAAWGWEHGASWPYLIGFLICVAQFVRPTFLGWVALFAPVITGAALYLFILAADLLRVLQGERAEIFLGVTDTLVFLSLECLLLLLVVGLIRVRPSLQSK